ncbi:MAG: OsmC family protein [Bacteroidetes bacterium]|nr:OsmC family protein [Bacteroidota bacterium]
MDTGVDEGGSGQGVGPMKVVAVALGGCSGIDIVIVLDKQRQDLKKFNTVITYDRDENETLALFTKLMFIMSLGEVLIKIRSAVR